MGLRQRIDSWVRSGSTLFGFATTMVLLMSAGPGQLQAQDIESVNGQVVSAESGIGLSNAQLYWSQARYAAITDLSGQFSIRASNSTQDSLIVRLVGFDTKRIPADRVMEGMTVVMEISPLGLPEVIVSATREEQLLSTVPAAVGRVDGEELTSVNPAHPSRIMNRIPGVWINATEGEGHMTAIRQPLSLQPLFLFLENGIPTRSTGFFNHNALFEVNIPQAGAIEVIKGPGTALYGSDAIGGVINVETGVIPSESSGSALIEGGSFGFRRLLVSGSRVTDQDGLRIDVNATQSDGWRRSTEYERQSATLSWQRRTTDASRLKTVATFTRVEQKPAGIAAISTEDYLADPKTNYTPISYRDVTAFRLSSSWQRFGSSSLLTVTPFFRYSSMELLPNWALRFDPAIWETENLSFGAQVRFRKELSGPIQRIVAGIDIDHSPGSRVETEIEADRVDALFVDYTVAALQYDYDVTFSQVAPYAHAEWVPVPDVRVVAGLRLDLSGYDYSNRLSVVETGSHQRPASDQVSYTNLSPQLGLTWTATPELGLFASYRHGFRVPSERQLFRQGRSRSSIDLNPVAADNFEVGARWNPDARLRAEATAFLIRKGDDIVTFNFEDGSRGAVNTGETEHRGLELGWNAGPFSGLSVAGAFTLAEHTYEEWVTELDEDFGGNEMELAPRTLTQMEVAYDIPVLRGVLVALELHRVGRYWMDPNNSTRYDGHRLIHVRADASVTEDITVLMRIGNLTDELYAQRALTNAFRGDEWAPGLPRSVNVSVRFGF